MRSISAVLTSKRGWLRLWIAGTALWWALVALYQIGHPNLNKQSTIVEGVAAAVAYPLAALAAALLLRWVWRGFAGPAK